MVSQRQCALKISHLTPPFHGGNPGSSPGRVTNIKALKSEFRGFLIHALMAELADALDLGSSGKPWGFKSL